MKLNVYLNFQGQSEEAVLFYAKAFGGQTPRILKYGDMPANPNFPIPEEAKGFVMHTELNIGDSLLRISDTLPNMPFTQGNDAQISVDFKTEAEFDCAYAVLSEGATTIVPVGPSFFANKYTYLTDKFGKAWHLIVPKEQH